MKFGYGAGVDVVIDRSLVLCKITGGWLHKHCLKIDENQKPKTFSYLAFSTIIYTFSTLLTIYFHYLYYRL